MRKGQKGSSVVDIVTLLAIVFTFANVVVKTDDDGAGRSAAQNGPQVHCDTRSKPGLDDGASGNQMNACDTGQPSGQDECSAGAGAPDEATTTAQSAKANSDTTCEPVSLGRNSQPDKVND
jgi:hypothetical protein